MHELVVNLHMHTRYSDGSGTHKDIARAALAAGLDAVIITDHNVLVDGFEGYYQEGKRRLLMLVGEEVHDQARLPQKNHLLVLGAGQEMATFASDPQRLIDRVRRSGGLAFIAHPVESALPAFGEDDISWVDWEVRGFHGLEIWNGLSEFKSVVKSKLQAYFFAFFPQYINHAPLPETLQRWDELLASGLKIAALGGSDAHAWLKSAGPFRRVIFPYEYHFHAVNTHLLTPTPLSGDLAADRRMILEALAVGRSFVGYDRPASTRGFRFSAQGRDALAQMGDEIPVQGGVTLQVHLPAPAKCRLICNGRVVRDWQKREVYTYITTEPGAYRVEAYRPYLGRLRGWIFSNPIYVRS
jgi:hypothetical protein